MNWSEIRCLKRKNALVKRKDTTFRKNKHFFFLSKTNTFFLLRNTLDKVVALIWVVFQKVMHKLVIGNGSFRQNTNWFRFVINPRIYSDAKPGFVYGKNGILTRFCYTLFIFIAMYACWNWTLRKEDIQRLSLKAIASTNDLEKYQRYPVLRNFSRFVNKFNVLKIDRTFLPTR